MMRRALKTFLLFVFAVFAQVSYAQTETTASIVELLNKEIDNLSGISDNSYSDPTDASMDTWKTIIDNITKQDFTDLDNLASSLGYELLKVTDNSKEETKTYYLLRKSSSGDNHWGTYAFNFNSACDNNLIIEAPHPIADRNTGNQGVFAFKEVGAYAFFLSGTHRCNGNVASTCSGTTSVCSGSSEAYRISDVAHNTDSPFQKATEIVANNLKDAVFIQLHGFTKRDSDPYLIMSNGTKEDPSGTDYAKELKNELADVDGSLTFQIGHINSNWTRLLGTTNTQGRFINGSSDPCYDAATSASGRFIHIEQEYSRLREDETGWIKMTKGLAKAFNCPIEIITDIKNENSLAVYPNPFSDHLYLKGSFPVNSKVKIRNMSGHLVLETKISGVIDTTSIMNPGIYYMTVELVTSITRSVKLLKV